MRLYTGNTQKFINDTNENRIAGLLEEAFSLCFGHNPSPSEKNSWTNSLQFLKNILESKNLKKNHIILEYELPYSTKRIDCILLGENLNGDKSVVVIELKQWSEARNCDIDGNVIAYVGHSQRMIAHPSIQVRGYHYLLKDFLTTFEDKPLLNLYSCVYCHNYSRDDKTLLLPKFKEFINEFPIFAKEDFEKIGNYLKEKLEGGKGLEIFNRFARSRIAPSKKLMEHTKYMIEGQHVFTLVDEQIVANNTIISKAKSASKFKHKTVVIVKGGPGTGKSVIALNAVAELLTKKIVVFHATGSAAFTSTIRKIVGPRAANFFKYFNSFPGISENEIDVLICDEAHRIRKTSNSRWTRKEMRSDLPQADELIQAAKVSIFFIDDNQLVRPEEIGSSELIRETAKKYQAEIFEFNLTTQFRCNGSDGYLNWVDNTLGVKDTANRVLKKDEKMEFKIFDSPEKMYKEIKARNIEKPNSARIVAGFCWPWSNPNPDGSLINDVVIGNFSMPWEGKEGKLLAKGIPEWRYWAFDPNGVDQIGCIYTIQGFEFDYIGVIFGKDFRFDSKEGSWIADKSESQDPFVKKAKTEEEFLKYVRNVYRVLLTRGMKGCYVYFCDKETEKLIRSRINI